MDNNKGIYSRKGKWKKKSSAFFYFFVLVGIACTLTNCKHQASVQEVPCSSLLVDSITFPFNKIDFGSVVYGDDRKSNIYFYNDGTHYRCIRYSGNGKPLDTIKYPMDTHYFTGFYPITKDSFAILTPSKLLLYGVKSKDTLTYNPPLKGFRFWGNHNNGYPLEISDSLAFFLKCEDTLVVNTRKNWELYRKFSNNETFYNLRKGQLENIQSAGYPEDVYANNSYYSLAYFRCLNKEKHQLIYNYPHSENMYVFNYVDRTLKEYKVLDPKFMPDDTFDYDRIGDFNYISKYLTENCRCGALKYNAFRKEYYLPVLYKGVYATPNSDEVVNFTEKPWTMFVLDSDFTVKEKIDFPAKKYNVSRILPLQKGFLVGYYSNIQSKKDTSQYAVFEF